MRFEWLVATIDKQGLPWVYRPHPNPNAVDAVNYWRRVDQHLSHHQLMMNGSLMTMDMARKKANTLNKLSRFRWGMHHMNNLPLLSPPTQTITVIDISIHDYVEPGMWVGEVGANVSWQPPLMTNQPISHPLNDLRMGDQRWLVKDGRLVTLLGRRVDSGD